MKRGIIACLVLLMTLAACSGNPSPTATITNTPHPNPSPLPTQTISPQDLTNAANFLTENPRVFPPTFTPTFTPSITNTPTATFTPSVTPTFTPVPEDALCESFVAGAVFMQGMNPRSPQFWQVFTPVAEVSIRLEFIDAETEEVLAYADIPGGHDLVFEVPANIRNRAGEYIWRVSLQDAERSGMCLKDIPFMIAPTASPSPEFSEMPSEAPNTATPTASPSRTSRPTRTPRATQTATEESEE